ncbi:RluA family pseudouridine synthase [Inhella sp. 4Y17]|uniref:Pseudouridine synthase n=2 Tax=Inhella gelatinilytica TaxID=2795030 RepID=A0A931IVD7_9BURK|nr:RluA family pseudouridine synthase [Inhella gelatinilytica]
MEDDAAPTESLLRLARSWEGVVLPEWAGWRLDKALVGLYPGASRSHLQSLIDEGRVVLEGAACTVASRKLRPGSRLAVEWRLPVHAVPFEAEAIPIPVVYEDAHLLVVNKRAGWVVHPAAGNWSGTLLNALLAHHATAASLPRAGIVHRLDKDTSGLMVVAKDIETYHALVAALSERQVGREYMALVHGRVLADRTVEAPIGRDPRNRVRMGVVAGGKPARTDFVPLAAGKGHSLLHCILHSGRTHQIRVHAANMGWPLVGDALYGGRSEGELLRQGLHAARLKLMHPVTGKFLVWEAAPPADLAMASQSLTGWSGEGLPSA